MAIKPEPEVSSENERGGPAPPSQGPVPMPESPTTALGDRGGGPRTSEGKRRSSQNATKHGVFSKRPTIGDERDEDWIEHRAGMRESFQPQGRNEDLLVDQLALNRWQRLREECWMTEKLQLRLEGVDHCSRRSIDPELMGLPEDEAAWWHSDPTAAQAAAILLREGDLSAMVPFDAVASY